MGDVTPISKVGRAGLSSEDLDHEIRSYLVDDWCDMPKCNLNEVSGAVRAMLDFADELEPNPTGQFFAIEIRNRLASALGIQEGESQ